jgi:hypothetical protein
MGARFLSPMEHMQVCYRSAVQDASMLVSPKMRPWKVVHCVKLMVCLSDSVIISCVFRLCLPKTEMS